MNPGHTASAVSVTAFAAPGTMTRQGREPARLSLYRLEIFRCVADERGFRAAAQRLGISQPAVTRHVNLLETYFGGRLFERRGRGISLTLAGQRVYAMARTTLERVTAVQQSAALQRC